MPRIRASAFSLSRAASLASFSRASRSFFSLISASNTSVWSWSSFASVLSLSTLDTRGVTPGSTGVTACEGGFDEAKESARCAVGGAVAGVATGAGSAAAFLVWPRALGGSGALLASFGFPPGAARGTGAAFVSVPSARRGCCCGAEARGMSFVLRSAPLGV